MKFLITLLTVLHFFACAWVDLGKKPNGWETTKIDYLLDDRASTEYMAGLYWAITTFATVGYGDFTGANIYDYLFTMGVFVFFSEGYNKKLFGVCMFSYLMGNVNGLITQLNYEATLSSQQEENLESWLLKMDRAVQMQLSSKQCDFVIQYLRNYWAKNIKGIDTDSEFVEQLHPNLRRKVFFNF